MMKNEKKIQMDFESDITKRIIVLGCVERIIMSYEILASLACLALLCFAFPLRQRQRRGFL